MHNRGHGTASLAKLVAMAKRGARRSAELLAGLLAMLNRHNGAVTALATVVLAVVTSFYLMEVREQRLFNYRQLALSNAPQLEILPLAPFEGAGLLRTAARLVNRGGPLEKLRVRIVLVCCERLELATDKVDKLRVLPWARYAHRVARDQARNHYLGITDEQRTWLEPAMKDDRVTRVYAYVRAEYTRPANPVEAAAELVDSASFWWNPKFNQWMELSPDGHSMLEKVVGMRKVFVPGNDTVGQ